MNSHELEEARLYEKRARASIENARRPAYHLTAPAGWLNDPNGFSYYQGCCHLFFQYYPYASHWGPVHWGHAISDDLVYWEYLPAALAPDQEYDRDGCFSGSAVQTEDGKHLLMYTGVRREEQADHTVREVQTQCVAVGDGIDYVKSEKNPVIGSDQIPRGGSPFDFRDPHIVKRPDGGYCCYVAGRNETTGAQVLLYESDDGIIWNFAEVFAENEGRYGRMWECPDYFELDGRRILLVSVMNMLSEGLDFQCGNHAVCLISGPDGQDVFFRNAVGMQVDSGLDFYAPQTVLMPDGRRIMVGWMQNTDALSFRDPGEPWAGQMSVPRELRVLEGRLCQMPVRELENYRANKRMCKNIVITDADEGVSSDSEGCELPGIRGRVAEILLRIRPADTGLYRMFEMRMAQNEENFTSLRFMPEEAVLVFDRTFSGTKPGILHQSRCRIESDVRDLHLRVLIDRFSVEVFVENGYRTMSSVIYTPENADHITFLAEGSVLVDVTKYDLYL